MSGRARLLVERIPFLDGVAMALAQGVPSGMDVHGTVLDAIRSSTLRAWLGDRLVVPDELPRLWIAESGLGWIEPVSPRIVRLTFSCGEDDPPQSAPELPADLVQRMEDPPWNAAPVLISSIELSDFLKRLAEAYARPVHAAKRGRKPEFDWEHGAIAAWQWRELHGFPDGDLTPLIEHVMTALEQKHGYAPDESTVRRKVRVWLKDVSPE